MRYVAITLLLIGCAGNNSPDAGMDSSIDSPTNPFIYGSDHCNDRSGQYSYQDEMIYGNCGEGFASSFDPTDCNALFCIPYNSHYENDGGKIEGVCTGEVKVSKDNCIIDYSMVCQTNVNGAKSFYQVGHAEWNDAGTIATSAREVMFFDADGGKLCDGIYSDEMRSK